MAGKRIEMKDVHSIVLMLSQGYGTKHISAALGGLCPQYGKSVPGDYCIKRLTYEDLLACPTEELNQFFTSQKPEEDDDRLDKLEDAFKNADGCKEIGHYLYPIFIKY